MTLSAGANSTKAGLLFNARSGTPGILLSGNGKIVLLDEMDKIAEDDIEYCYEIMSEGNVQSLPETYKKKWKADR